ncbi:MAG: metallophosphatase family protein [Fibromonadaceae bacterium]|jgi:diadenosine tetraphosphatase ApaH/serine/threonine PP2A family protein phosphatase|nr:metallophosphatase family protein [Fibromonadaceae bacterium]
MLYGIFSDIHANLPALEAVLRSMDSRKVERRICLGDIVGYGVSPNECAALVKQHSDLCILGNHDNVALQREAYSDFNIYAKAAMEWTWKHLNDQTKDYLNSLPYFVEEDNFTFVHSSPMSPADWHYVADLDGALEAFFYFNTPYCFIGHTHSPVIISTNSKNPYEEIPTVSEGPLYRPEQNEKILINVGSVGQPRDRNRRACWCLVDSEGNWIEFVRVEYDIEKTQNQMRKENMPMFLVERLALGR